MGRPFVSIVVAMDERNAIGWNGKLRISMAEGGELRQYKPSTEP